EGATGHFLDRQLAVAGLLAEGGDAVLDFGQAHQLGVAQHRYHQATVAGHGHADVLVAVVDDVVAVDRGVDCREALERLDGGLDEEGHEAQAHAVVGLLEQVLVLAAQGHDFMHVHLVEGGQHGHGGLRFDQALGDLGTQTGHRHALLDAIAGGEQRRIGGRGGRLDGSSSGRGLLGGDGGDGIFLGDATTLAGTDDGVRVDTTLFGNLACGRRQDGVVASGGSGGRSSGGRSGSRRSRGSGDGSTGGAQAAQQLAGEHGFALVLDDLGEYAVGFGEYFHHHLVGFDVDDQLIALDRIARLLVPGGDGAVGNRFREGWG